jgi:hypothetical protein
MSLWNMKRATKVPTSFHARPPKIRQARWMPTPSTTSRGHGLPTLAWSCLRPSKPYAISLVHKRSESPNATLAKPRLTLSCLPFNRPLHPPRIQLSSTACQPSQRNTRAPTANATSRSPNAPICSSTSAPTAAKSRISAAYHRVANASASWEI